jgi:phosphatidylserine/phosphatidylglycerophosphate/cardiolipin synthase-like enzyme
MWFSITTPDRATAHHLQESDDLEAWLIEVIDGATEEVLVAVQELNLPRFVQALIAAQQRGIRVAVVMENNYRQAWSEQWPSRLNPR